MDEAAKRNSPSERIVQSIHQELRERIIDGRYKNGQKFNQAALAKEFKVSRTPVTKALNILESEGIVDGIPQKGFYVHVLTVKDLLELYKLRESIDMMIAKDVVRWITPAQIQELEDMFSVFSSDQPIDTKEYMLVDRKFHARLIEISDNQLLKKIYQAFPIGYIHYRAGLARKPLDTLKDHYEIINAFKSKDIELARTLLGKHAAIARDRVEKISDGLLNIGINPGNVAIDEFDLFGAKTG